MFTPDTGIILAKAQILSGQYGFRLGPAEQKTWLADFTRAQADLVLSRRDRGTVTPAQAAASAQRAYEGLIRVLEGRGVKRGDIDRAVAVMKKGGARVEKTTGVVKSAGVSPVRMWVLVEQAMRRRGCFQLTPRSALELVYTRDIAVERAHTLAMYLTTNVPGAIHSVLGVRYVSRIIHLMHNANRQDFRRHVIQQVQNAISRKAAIPGVEEATRNALHSMRIRCDRTPPAMLLHLVLRIFEEKGVRANTATYSAADRLLTTAEKGRLGQAVAAALGNCNPPIRRNEFLGHLGRSGDVPPILRRRGWQAHHLLRRGHPCWSSPVGSGIFGAIQEWVRNGNGANALFETNWKKVLQRRGTFAMTVLVSGALFALHWRGTTGVAPQRSARKSLDIPRQSDTGSSR